MCCSSCESKLKGHPARFLSKLEPAPGDSVLSVPESSVIDTGTKKIVFVETEPGHYEPRDLRLGREGDEDYEVLAGLRAGERVVTSANFLIDSESKIRAAQQPSETQ